MVEFTFLVRTVIEDAVISTYPKKYFHSSLSLHAQILWCHKVNNDTAVRCYFLGYICNLGEPETLFKAPKGDSLF
jgi:hypothetical protein